MLQFEEYKLKLRALAPELSDLRSALEYDRLSSELAALDEDSAKPEFWNDMQASQKVLQKIKQLRVAISSFDKLTADFEDLSAFCELADEEGELSYLPEIEKGYADLQKAIETKRLEVLLSGEYDANNAIISFHAGAGGTEAQDWALMLYRMYLRWGESRGYTCKTLDFLDGEGAGLKNATILIEGLNAYGYMKGESGVHRLVRISPFDSSGRRHTSFAAVEVMPEITGDVDIEISPDDLEVDTYRSGGAGGQHVNKTESAIRITHIPSGIVVACQNERSQFQNRDVAMRMLKSKLLEIKEREHLDKIEDIKGEQKLIEWGSQIRSYVFMPYTLAKDHRTGFESGNINAVMDGDLDGFINAYLKALAAGTLNLR